MSESYFDSEDFKQTLSRFLSRKREGVSFYMDSDDFINISDYYLEKGNMEEARGALDIGYRVHPSSVQIKIAYAGVMICCADFSKARNIIADVSVDEDYDVIYLKAQLLCALDQQFEEAEKKFNEWLAYVDEDYDEINFEDGQYDDKFDHDSPLRDARYRIMMSYIELTNNHHENYVRKWIRQYEKTFNHIGRFKEDYQVLDICRNLEYFDLMELLLPGILEINPYYNMGWTLLGVSQEMNGHYAEATSSLEYALAINPDDIPANVTYAQCMQVMGNFDRAIQYLLRYRELTNDFSQDIAIAKCYLNLKDYPNVRKYLIHPFEHVKNHPDTRQITDELMELAELLYACDEIDKTEDILNLLLANKPKHRTGLLLKGCVKLHKGNVEDAISLFVEIIEKFNFSPDILTDVASRFLAFEYEDISLRLLTAATESLTAEKKKSGRQHALMAVALLKKGIIDEALNHLKIACDTDTSYVKMYFADFLPDSIQENDYYEHLSSFFNSK